MTNKNKKQKYRYFSLGISFELAIESKEWRNFIHITPLHRLHAIHITWYEFRWIVAFCCLWLNIENGKWNDNIDTFGFSNEIIQILTNHFAGQVEILRTRVDIPILVHFS